MVNHVVSIESGEHVLILKEDETECFVQKLKIGYDKWIKTDTKFSIYKNNIVTDYGIPSKW